MNRITDAQRKPIQAEADKLIKLDHTLVALNYREVVEHLQKKFGISQQRALTHAAKAARKARRPHL